MKLSSNDFEVIKGCPWCGSNEYVFLHNDYLGCDIVRCGQCGLVYAKKRLNERGRGKFWADYLSRDHEANEEKVIQRNVMYEIESKFICDFVKGNDKKLLDVGCGKGDFMEHFKKRGFIIQGIEYGEEAYNEALKLNRNVLFGELPKITLKDRYDLIIFRGTIQYFPDPKSYFERAFDLLNEGGYIYLYYVNTNSICFSLFGNNFSVPITGADFIGYNDELLTSYFEGNGLYKVAERDYYLGTPYENWKKDVVQVARAVQMQNKNKKADFQCPPFFGNIIGTLYRRG